MRVKILASAVEDLHQARLFYQKQQEGLGAYFLDSLFADIDSLTRNGGIHLKVFDYHRLLSKKFPYAIYYKTEGKDLVVVQRVLDLRQAPAKIRSALT